MGNSVEDRFESDEVARAAYALDRMSPQEIARIISGDKREDVMRALAEGFSAKQVDLAFQDLPSIEVKSRLTDEYQGIYLTRRKKTDLITPQLIPLSNIDHISQQIVNTSDMLYYASSERPTILLTKDGEGYFTVKPITEIFESLKNQSQLKMNFNLVREEKGLDQGSNLVGLRVLTFGF